MRTLLRPRLRHLTTANFRATDLLCLSRAFHSAKAEFTTLNHHGSPTSKQIDVFIGDVGQSFVIFNKDVGFAMKSAIAQQVGVPLSDDPDKVPLTFFHESRCFAHGTTSYPKIVIGTDLPRQNKTSTSPATLWLWGASHSITLDGTGDHGFEESSRESHRRLKGVADLLRDM